MKSSSLHSTGRAHARASFRPFAVLSAVVLALGAVALPAATWTLDDAASPISAVFNDATGRLSVTVKSTGTVWGQGTAGGGNSYSLNGTVTQPDTKNLTVPALLNTYAVTLALQLVPATGELKVTISGNSTSIPNKITYPYPFFKSDGSGYAVLPYNGGFVVPTTATTWSQPSSHSRMEWVGGTDSTWNEGWMAIADPADDMFLVKQTPTVNGSSRLGGAFEWRGSNANGSLTPNLLSYSRTATFTFYASGGYVAQAQHFRDFANTKGWNVSLATKAGANADVNKLLGAPVIYLWGDGRSDTMLNALDTAGIANALVLLSINHVDQNNSFPNQTYANGNGWSAAVRTHGWVPGIYDIYTAYDSAHTAPTTYNGFFNQWAAGGAGSSSASTTWAYMNSDGTWDITYIPAPINAYSADIAHGKSAPFARDTRIPSHLSLFGLDAFFFDTTCALDPQEDYASAYGHSASRAQDIANRAALLAAASGANAPNHNKLAGTEQAKSWAVPHIHWTEGMFKLGASNSPGGYPTMGGFNNSVYPTTTCDVMDPGANLSLVLNTGYQAPLWELVYHDALLSTQHWHLAHNKLIYCWDFADLSAMIRGQAPLLHLAYNGDIGTVGRTLAGATDADTGITWNIKWTNANVPTRVMQTYNNVCAWHGIVGDLPMINHRILSADGSNNYLVQCSEFSDDGGVTGQGIVVNFGSYPGTGHVMTGSTWNGTLRGNSLSVPVNSYATYSWGSADTTPPAAATGFTATAGNAQVQLAWTNPSDADLAGMLVLRKTGSFPTSPSDGTVVLNDNVAPFATSITDTGLTNGTTYYYAVFAYDEVPNYSAAATASATPQLPPETTLLDENFETNFNAWTDGGTTDWDRTTAQAHGGSYSAHAGSADNDLISDNLNTTGYSTITISFWYRDDDIDDADDVYLQLYNGTTYTNKFELNPATEDTWVFYTVTLTNSGGDAQYFRSNFRLKFEGTSIDSGENLWIDDVKVTAQ